MIIDGFVHQLPDNDPTETEEWLQSLDAVVDTQGKTRARFLLSKLLVRARELQVGTPATVSTPYVNTIPPEQEPWFPGDEYLERRIRAYIRWNAAVMVVRANKKADGIGGHLSTFASSAALYDVGFNHFFRGKADGQPGDAVYLQGHAAPGFYARAFLEGRLTEEDLDNFRQEVGGGLSSYPHPRLMPHFWEYPTVSMGLGAINSIYHARFLRYLHDRRIDDTSGSRVWAFLGDGEMDEPETLGAITLPAREQLDNLIWVVNCNLQRLDGPVRGNGKIIQELEALFRGAGWNVIKVIWGSKWDELLARDEDGVLLDKMNRTVDGDFQRYAVESGAYTREHFFGPDPRLRKLVEHLSDDEIRNLPRGGHDYRKLYAAYKAATEQRGAPTVILTKTIKGWTLGPDVEGRNATHQIKKMSIEQLRVLRDRLYLQDVIKDEDLAEDKDPPYIRFPEGSVEHEYMLERRRVLDGPLPQRVVRVRSPLTPPDDKAFEEVLAGSGKQAVSTTMAFTRLLRNLMRDGNVGRRVVPIIPDEARTFGMDALFKEFKIYSPLGQRYTPVDAELLLSYSEAKDGQVLEEGITEAGSMASFIAAATSYAHRGVPMLPFFTFYSMFGFQRVGDLIWSAADSRARGFLLGATAGRTTLLGEGLQHQDGHSHVLASTVPSVEAWDPAFAYEMAVIIRHGIQEMLVDERDVVYYLTLYNENYLMPPLPEGAEEGILRGLYKWADAPEGPSHKAAILFSGPAQGAARAAQAELAERWDVGAELWSATSYKRLREEALTTERWNRLHPTEEQRTPLVTRLLGGDDAPSAVVAVTDYMKAVPDQIGRWVPKPFVPLGTDGFGRSDTRERLREFFEVDMPNVVVATLWALAQQGEVKAQTVADAIAHYGIDTERTDPRAYDL
ncbi:MAG: pyruvate dehydrogenase (acetyl-transferring), homodimeric type [Thermoanaerobacterales bacterium]|nr:pyruvate dehydrogenase (acetyl-transferring), homodimeric type [Thermoanaerobacterales bacterium]